MLHTAIPEDMGSQPLGTSTYQANNDTQLLILRTKENSPGVVNSSKLFLQPPEPTNIAGSTPAPGPGNNQSNSLQLAW